MIIETTLDLIGKTPLLKLNKLTNGTFNLFGNPFMAVMSKGNSPERIKILKALGAEVVLTQQVDGQPGMVTGKDIAFASSFAKNLALEKGGFYVDQFNNPSGMKAHFETTIPEIWADLPEADAFVASVGTGGTFLVTSQFLKTKNNKLKCIAVEPANAAIIKKGYVDNPRHIIQGIGWSQSTILEQYQNFGIKKKGNPTWDPLDIPRCIPGTCPISFISGNVSPLSCEVAQNIWASNS